LDKSLFSKYEKEIVPFDGLNIHSNTYIPLGELRNIIGQIVNFLDSKSLIGDQMYKMWDWFEHDGYLSKRSSVSTEFFKLLIKSDESFYSNHSGETYVNIGLLDNSSRWYLRIYIVDDYDLEDDEQRNGKFDISLDSNVARELLVQLNENGVDAIKCDNSKEYLRTKYSG